MADKVIVQNPDDILKLLRSNGIRPDPDVSFKVTRSVKQNQSSITIRITLWDPLELRHSNKQLFNPTQHEIIECYHQLLGIPLPKSIAKPVQELPRKAQVIKHIPIAAEKKQSKGFTEEDMGSVRTFDHPPGGYPKTFWTIAYVTRFDKTYKGRSEVRRLLS